VIGLTGLSVVNQCAPFCQTNTEGDFLAYVFIGGGAFLSIIGAVLLGAGIMKSGKKAIFCHSCGASVDSHSVFCGRCGARVQ
jgi:hypothetical protein